MFLQEVAALVGSYQLAGQRQVTFDAQGLASRI
jgi:hypothetical protein